MSSLRNFYSSAVGSQMAVGRLRLGDGWLDVRHMTVANVMEIWDLLVAVPVGEGGKPTGAKSVLQRWAEFWLTPELPAEQRDCSWVSPVFEAGIRVLFRHEGQERVREIMAAPADDLRGLYDFYVGFHDWPRILREIFDIHLDPKDQLVKPGGTRRNSLSYLMEMEKETGRTIEGLLGMRVEAFLDFIDERLALAEEQRSENASARGVSTMPASLLGLAMPGFALSLNRTKNPEDEAFNRMFDEAAARLEASRDPAGGEGH